MSEQQTREGAFKVFVATSGCGKTTDIKTYLNSKRRNLIIPSGKHDVAFHGIPALEWHVEQVEDRFRPGKLVPKVIIPDLNTFTGTRVLHVDGDSRIFDAIPDPVTGLNNARLVMDDYRNYVYSNANLKHEVITMFRQRRHRMLDIFMACHSVEDVSRQLLALNPQIIMGYTTTQPTDTSIGKVANGARMLETMVRVNRINAAKPEGQRFYKEIVPGT